MSEAPASMPPAGEDCYQIVFVEALRLLGADEGAKFMTTRNFALGGQTPAQLARTDEGARQVLNELVAHEHGGPL